MSARYLRSLLFKTARIQEEIEREQKAHRPDWIRLLRLKKLRLAVKDRIQQLLARRPVRRTWSSRARRGLDPRPSLS